LPTRIGRSAFLQRFSCLFNRYHCYTLETILVYLVSHARKKIDALSGGNAWDVALPFSGGCACGVIRYECTAEPITMFNCHGRDCQRASGTAFSAVVYVTAKAFKITKGSPRDYSTSSEAVGHTKRGFCADCDSRLFGGGTERDKVSMIRAWMIRACSNRRCICAPRTLSRGIKWTQSCRSLKKYPEESSHG
jgi:hypothetical protein